MPGPRESSILVGRTHQVPKGGSILPQFESRAFNGNADLEAARGIVLANTGAAQELSIHRVWRDILRRQPGGGFGGHVSTYSPPGSYDLVRLASDHAKEVLEQLAHGVNGRDPRNAVVGHIHKVAGDFTEDPERGPTNLVSNRTVRVLGSYPVRYGEMLDHGVLELPDPLQVPEVARDIQAVFASGMIALAIMEAMASDLPS